jgi:hypothetical protein
MLAYKINLQKCVVDDKLAHQVCLYRWCIPTLNNYCKIHPVHTSVTAIFLKGGEKETAPSGYFNRLGCTTNGTNPLNATLNFCKDSQTA